MATRQCEQCDEAVDSARAFCPSCGNPFVQEEQREQKSNYEKMDKTMQMGKTMYGNMLSDMGLNISKPQPEKRVETIAPIGAPPKRGAARPEAPRQETLTPAAAEPSKSTPAARPVEPPPPVGKRKTYIVWGLIAGGVLLIGLIGIVIIAGAFYYYSLNR